MIGTVALFLPLGKCRYREIMRDPGARKGGGDGRYAPLPGPLRSSGGPRAASAGHSGSDSEPRITSLDAYIRDLVASAPPLTPAQRDRLALLFRRPGPARPG
jgi:hypothetical protein